MKSTFIKDVELEDTRCALTIFQSHNNGDKYGQHAALIVEGCNAGEMWYWYIDFIPSKTVLYQLRSPLGRYDLVEGEIRICKFYEGQNTPESQELARKGFTSDFLQNMLCDERTSVREGSFKSCVIEEELAEKLLKDFEEQAKNPPKYRRSGNAAFVARINSFFWWEELGHNCITLIEENVNALGIDINKSFKASFVDNFLAVPSYHVRSDRQEDQSMCRIS